MRSAMICCRGGGIAQVSARQEYRHLVDSLNLPVRERLEERRARRAVWQECVREQPVFEHIAGP